MFTLAPRHKGEYRFICLIFMSRRARKKAQEVDTAGELASLPANSGAGSCMLRHSAAKTVPSSAVSEFASGIEVTSHPHWKGVT